jgi:hypothetical protein
LQIDEVISQEKLAMFIQNLIVILKLLLLKHLRSCSALRDKLSDIDNFENMTKAEKELVCYWLARSMMA